jgi:hypothetical protein
MPSPSLQRPGNRPAKPRHPSSSRPETVAPHPLDELIEEIAYLQWALIEQLKDRRNCLRRELSSVDAELAELTAEVIAEPKAEEKAPSAPSAPPPSPPKRNTALPELIAILGSAPGKMLNLRKANLDAESVKALVKAYPQLLKFGGKGTGRTVTLLDRAQQNPSNVKPKGSAKTKGSHPDLFSFRDPSSGPPSP